MLLVVGDEKLEDGDLGGYMVNSQCEVTIGEGDTLLSELFDKVICSMKENEMCYVKSKVDAKGKKVSEFEVGNKALKFNVTLVNLGRAADLQDLELDEKLDRAQHHKEKGTELYLEDKSDFSVKRFRRALDYLESMEPVETLPEEMFLRYTKLKCLSYLNLGACYLKRDKYNQVVDYCTKALELESNNVKGLFRRGQAYTKLHEYKKAKEDLGKARQLETNNKAVLNQLRTVEVLISKEKQMYQKMFKN